jgi:hypothetical protein
MVADKLLCPVAPVDKVHKLENECYNSREFAEEELNGRSGG